jgi:hypothetical protein
VYWYSISVGSFTSWGNCFLSCCHRLPLATFGGGHCILIPSLREQAPWLEYGHQQACIHSSLYFHFEGDLHYINNTPSQLMHNPSTAYLSDVFQALLKEEMLRYGGINKLAMNKSLANGFPVSENNSVWERDGPELSPQKEII